MDNDKRILLAVALSIAVLFGYQYLFTPVPQKGKQPGEEPAAAPRNQTPQAMEQQPPAVQDPAAAAPHAMPAPQAPADDRAPDISITTALFTSRFSCATAGPASFKLHKYRESLAPSAAERLMHKLLRQESPPVDGESQKYKELVHASSIQQLPLRTLFVDAAGQAGAGLWQADKDALTLASDTPRGKLTFHQRDPQNLTIIKQFTFSDEDYAIGLELRIKNDSTTGRTGSPVVEWRAPVPAGQGGGFFSGTATDIAQFTYLLKDSVVKQNLDDIKGTTPIEGDIGWTAVEEKYFMSALLFDRQKPVQVRVGRNPDGSVAYQVYFPAVALQPGQEASYQLKLYMGPKDMDILARQEAHLEKTIDFGWFDIIAKPLLMCLKFFYGFLGNYGLAIILLTIIIKILFWPLTHKSFASMKGMQKIQPELQALKEKYKDNKEEFARQQLALYRKYNVNPLSGCLPIFIQIPVFIALYNALMYSIELRHANFVSFWINDLSAKDPTYIAPIVMGLSQFLQQKMTPSAGMDPAQAKMMLFMPLIFTVMFLSFPSGLVIYWLVNNIISLVQQLYINKKISAAGGKECSPSKSRPKQSKKQ